MQVDFVTTFGIVEGFPSFPEATLARALTADGHTVRALTYYAKSSPMIDAHHARIDGTVVHRIRRKGLIAPGTLRWIMQNRPDLAHIHHHSNRLSALALPAYHARGVPVVFSPYGILHDPELVADTDRPLEAPLRTARIQRSLVASARALGARHGAFVWALHRPLFAADAIHAMSEHERRILIDDLGIPEQRVHFIPVGIDAGLLAAPHPVARTDHPTVLYIGQMKYRKGWDVLLRAIPETVRCVPEAQFVFVGHTGRDREDFDALARDLGIARWLDLRGRVNEAEKVTLLRSSWVLTLPARYEGFGIPLVEAMMCETPVVTTDVPACNEIVEDGATGLRVPPDDPAALAAALVRLLRDEQLRHRLGAAGYMTAMRRYAAPVVARQFERLYASLADRRH
ncbi:MAG: glycosyltransferase family 4 protein [Thermomicrobiales bacterium]